MQVRNISGRPCGRTSGRLRLGCLVANFLPCGGKATIEALEMMTTANEPNTLLLFTDSEPGKEFVSTLERKLNVRPQTYTLRPFWIVKVNKALKHLAYVAYAWKAFRIRNEGKFLFFSQQAMAFYYSHFMRCLSSSGRPTTATPIIYKERRGILGRLRKHLFRSYLRSPAIDIFIAHSQAEKSLISCIIEESQQDKIRFIPLGFGTPVSPGEIEAVKSPQSDPYFFSGGTSNRDYRTLLKAFEDFPERLKIICRQHDLKGLMLPPNVEVRYGIYGEEFIEVMRQSLAVVIPLGRDAVSSGHMLLLQAMRWGKPIILTHQAGVMDYVDDHSVLLVQTSSHEDIRQAVLCLKDDKELCTRLGNSAAHRYNENYTGAKYAARLASLL